MRISWRLVGKADYPASIIVGDYLAKSADCRASYFVCIGGIASNKKVCSAPIGDWSLLLKNDYGDI